MAQIVTNDPDYFLNDTVQGSFNDKSEDNSGLGVYPAAEQNNTYFAYFNAATSTEPEILNKSAVYINYLIDSNGNLTNPKPGDIALYNLKNTFEQGSTMFITPEDPSQVYSPLIGENVIENIGTVQLVLTSETGKTPSSFLDDIKVGTKPRYNQTFVPDYTTGQSPFFSGSGTVLFNEFGGLSFLTSSAVSNFTASFTPIYYASSSNGYLEFRTAISGSPSDTGSLTNMEWDTVAAEWTFINIDSPEALNLQMTADFRLDFSALIDIYFSGSIPGTEDYSWTCAPWYYEIEAKFQLWDDASSTWNDVSIDVNTSKFDPKYGTKVFKDPGYGKVLENQFPSYFNFWAQGNTNTATTHPSNSTLFLNSFNQNASTIAEKIRVEGYAVSQAQFDSVNRNPNTGLASGQHGQYLSYQYYYWRWNEDFFRYDHFVSIYGDQYIYMKSVPFVPKYNDKLRVVMKLISNLYSDGPTPANFNYFPNNPGYAATNDYVINVMQRPPITLVINNSSLNASFITTNQNYDPSLMIPADGVLPIDNIPTYISASYWNTGSIPSLADNSLMWLTASQALSNFILASQNYYQNFYDDSETLTNLGYSNPLLPIDPLPGDYIRFEYDDTKQYRILAVDPNNPSGFAIGVFPPVPYNTKLNHFTISRVIDDGNYIIINSEYPASGSVTDNLTGFTKPKYITSILESEFTKITTDLVKSGVLKNQV